MIEGKWAKDDIRRAFVAGAKWWEFHRTGGTMWQSDRNLAEAEASKRYAPQKAVAPSAQSRCNCYTEDYARSSGGCPEHGVI